MARKYRVKAPYVTLTTTTATGRSLVGYYAGAPVPDDVPEAQLKHHLDNDLIEEVDDPATAPPAEGVMPAVQRDAIAAAEQARAGTAGEDTGGAADEGVGDPPHGNAALPAWRNYGRRVLTQERGVSDDDATTYLEGKSKQDLVSEFGRPKAGED